MSVSPWAHEGVSASALAVGSVIWLCAMQLVSAGAGGYTAGRLRLRWSTVHSDEVYFRDTAHGLLVWAVGVVISAAVLTSAASGLVGATGRGATIAASGISKASAPELGSSTGAQSIGPSSQDETIDLMMRRETATAAAAPDAVQRAEIGRLLSSSMRRGQLGDADRTYLANEVAAYTGLQQAAAEQRVDTVYATWKSEAEAAADTARRAADAARRTAASFSLWLFLSFLIGAFSASYAATIGGRQRDGVRPHTDAAGVRS
jgi:hypothetical protein